MTAGPRESQPLVDLQELVAGIRWNRRLWSSLALLGLLAGGLLGALKPDPPHAVVRLLIVHEDDQSASSMQTDLALIRTLPVSAAAVESLGIDERPETFRAGFTAESVTSDIAELQVAGRTPEDAMARAQALADAAIAEHVARSQSLADAEAEALTARLEESQRQLEDMGSLAPGEAAGADRDALIILIADLRERAEAARVGAPRAAVGTQVVDPPQVVRQTVPEAVEYGALGLVLGLGGGLAFALVMGVVRDRPVLRRDIASHLGASVIVQLPAPRRGPSRLWRRSRGVRERRRVAALLARLTQDVDGPMSLLELGAAKIAAEVAVGVAEELAPERATLLLDDLVGSPVHAAALRAGGTIPVIGGEDFPDPAESPDGPPPCRIGVGSVAPGTSWIDLPRLGTETVLIVRAGVAGATWLHTVARQLADLDIVVIGVLLVHPDPRDRTDGTLWDGLQHALRGRAASHAGPAPAPTARPALNGHAPDRSEVVVGRVDLVKAIPRDGATPTNGCTPRGVPGNGTANGAGKVSVNGSVKEVAGGARSGSTAGPAVEAEAGQGAGEPVTAAPGAGRP